MNNMVDKNLYDEVRASANIITGEECSKLFCTVAQVVSDMVSQTLGPYGATTIIDDGGGFTYPTKDGWSCMNRLRFNDPLYNTIFGIIKQVSFNSVTTVGDGTTTAMVATSNFMNELYTNTIPNLAEVTNVRQATLLEAINNATDEITNELRNNQNVIQIDPEGDFNDIYNVAYIATNGNTQFSEIIQKIYQETRNPHIRLEMDNSASETNYVIEHGYRFDCKPIAMKYYINSEDGTIHKDDKPFKVFICDNNVTYTIYKTIITALSQLASVNDMDIVILAPYFDDIVCSIIEQNAAELTRQRKFPNLMLIQIPTTMRMHQQAISDISTITDTLVFTETMAKVFNIMVHNASVTDEEDKIKDSLLDLPQFSKYEYPQQMLESCLGTIGSAIIRKTDAFIQDYDKYMNREKYDLLVAEVESEYVSRRKKAMKTINGMIDKDYLNSQMRYIRLLGNSGIIKVGGISDIQRKCDYDSLDDAVRVCRSAFEYGYVRGMCLEILNVTKNLHMKYLTPSTSKIDYDARIYQEVLLAIYGAFAKTFSKIIINKHPDIDQDSIYNILTMCLDNNCSYDLRTETIQEVGNWTVINSVQTDIEILSAMTSILTTIMTSSQFLSVHRNGDPNYQQEKALDDRLKLEYAVTTSKLEAVTHRSNAIGVFIEQIKRALRL